MVWKDVSFECGLLVRKQCVMLTGLICGWFSGENTVGSAPEHAACWGGNGANPGVAEVNCACLVVKVIETAHEGVEEATEMESISYLLGEDVADVVVSDDVFDLECVVLDPFVNRILFEFRVTYRFQSHVMGPEDGGLVVVVQQCRGIGVGG